MGSGAGLPLRLISFRQLPSGDGPKCPEPRSKIRMSCKLHNTGQNRGGPQRADHELDRDSGPGTARRSLAFRLNPLRNPMGLPGRLCRGLKP